MKTNNKLREKYEELVEIKTLNPKWLPLSILLLFIAIPLEEGVNSLRNHRGFFDTIYDIYTDSFIYIFFAIFIPIFIAIVFIQRAYIIKKYQFLINERLSVLEKREKFTAIYKKQYNKIASSKVFHNKERNDKHIQFKLDREDFKVKKQILEFLSNSDDIEFHIKLKDI